MTTPHQPTRVELLAEEHFDLSGVVKAFEDLGIAMSESAKAFEDFGIAMRKMTADAESSLTDEEMIRYNNLREGGMLPGDALAALDDDASVGGL